MNQLCSQNDDVTVVIPAAGAGERLGLGPKALLELNGKPLLVWLTQKVLQITKNVIVTAPADQLDFFQSLCPKCKIVAGGATRQDSVKRLVEASSTTYIVIHDVARPFASLSLFNSVITKAKENGCAGAFLQPDIPVAIIENDIVVQHFQRSQVGIFQSPQAFKRDYLIEAIKAADDNNWQEQSTLQLMLKTERPVHAVHGEKNNIKLTTREDWQIAQLLTEYLK